MCVTSNHTWGVTLVTVALHGGVPLLLEGPVHAAPVLKSVLGKSVFWPDSCRLLLVFSWCALVASYRLSWKWHLIKWEDSFESDWAIRVLQCINRIRSVSQSRSEYREYIKYLILSPHINWWRNWLNISCWLHCSPFSIRSDNNFIFVSRRNLRCKASAANSESLSLFGDWFYLRDKPGATPSTAQPCPCLPGTYLLSPSGRRWQNWDQQTFTHLLLHNLNNLDQQNSKRSSNCLSGCHYNPWSCVC